MRRYFAVCGGIIGWALGVLVPAYGRWPAPTYDPAARRWFVSRFPGPLPIGYYGLVLYGLAGALVGAGLARALRRPGRRAEGSEASIWLGAAWALTALVVVGAYYTFQLWP
ncbi:MAG TPA: hypothetical protein VKN99_15220 [Polyangia bacterium]|nr:hypothetical protein [Polyangia bacterium]